MSVKISGSKYAAMYGPTVGDKVRLADTSLVIEVEKDYTTYGDEVKFGGGKSIRDGMGQSVKTCSRDGDLDLVITNALIVDATGIVKADIGIKDGKIAGIGKAGNPDVMDGVTPGMTVGASTEALAGEGMIVTAGGIDTHIHFISPQQIRLLPLQRRNHDDRRRHRPGGRHERNDVYPGTVESAHDAESRRGISDEPWFSRQGQLLRRGSVD